ncbi:MAG: RICIN domain-containing protein [Fibrobacterales bacterium]
MKKLLPYLPKIVLLTSLFWSSTIASYNISKIPQPEAAWKSIAGIDDGTIYFSGTTQEDYRTELYSSTQSGYTQLTNSTNYKSFLDIEGATYVWNDDNQSLWFFNGTQNIPLAQDLEYGVYYAKIDGGSVVWSVYDGTDNEIFYYNGTETVQLTDNDDNDVCPSIDNGEIAWNTYNYNPEYSSHISLYKDGETRLITSSAINYCPQIDNGVIVWYGYPAQGEMSEIYMYANNEVKNISNSPETDYNPILKGGTVVWEHVYKREGSGRSTVTWSEIIKYDGSSLTSVSGQDLDYSSPDIDGDGIVFIGSTNDNYYIPQVYHVKGADKKVVTINSKYKHTPRISEGTIYWIEGSVIYSAVPGIDPDQAYTIVSKQSGKVLDIADNNLNNGANLQQWDYNGDKNQLWYIAPETEGYSIVSEANNKAIDVSGISNENGANIHLWDFVGGTNQLWNLNDNNDGFFSIESRHSNKVLDVADFATWNGGNIHQWDFSNGDNQLWELIRIPFEFKWLYEDVNNNGAWDYSYTSAPDNSNFLTANNWGNAVMTSEEAFEGNTSLKIYIDHTIGGTAGAYITTNPDGTGTEPTNQEEFASAKDISKANYMTFNLLGTQSGMFDVCFLTSGAIRSECTTVYSYSYPVWEWTEKRIDLEYLKNENFDFTNVSRVVISITPEHPLEHMVFFIDNISFIE